MLITCQCSDLLATHRRCHYLLLDYLVVFGDLDLEYFANARSHQEVLVDLPGILRILIQVIASTTGREGGVLKRQVVHGPVT